MPHLTDSNRRILAKRRDQMQMSQQALADKLGIHRVTLAKVESGEREPSDAMLTKLADALGLSVTVTTTVRLRRR